MTESKEILLTGTKLRPNGTVTQTAAVAEHTLLTIAEVASLLKTKPSWVYDHVRRRSRDRIPGFRLGKYWRFREADVLAWLEQQRVGTRPNA